MKATKSSNPNIEKILVRLGNTTVEWEISKRPIQVSFISKSVSRKWKQESSKLSSKKPKCSFEPGVTTQSKVKTAEWEEQDGKRKVAQEWVEKANADNVERMRQESASGTTEAGSPVEADPIWEALVDCPITCWETGPPGWEV